MLFLSILSSCAVVLLTLYFGYVSIYNFVLSVAGLFYRKRKIARSHTGKFAVFIPAYKEDNVIVDVAMAALKQDYPASRYTVIVIADSLKQETILKLRGIPVDVVEVSFEQSTKVKALNVALSRYQNEFDRAVILDADNVMDASFLRVMNALHDSGHKAIQGRRASKNDSNDLAVLDGLSEEINNHINGKGNSVLGLSASLKGSGMSFDYELLRSELITMHSVGGFDRELEVRFLQDGVSVQYAPEAIVYDEKVEKSQVFQNQRKRWIASQYQYLWRYFIPGCKALLDANFALFNSAILRNVQLPRLLNIGLITTLAAAGFVFNLQVKYIWLALWFIMIISTICAIPKHYFNKRLVALILSTPQVFWMMILVMFKLRNANKKFIHTPHGAQ